MAMIATCACTCSGAARRASISCSSVNVRGVVSAMTLVYHVIAGTPGGDGAQLLCLLCLALGVGLRPLGDPLDAGVPLGNLRVTLGPVVDPAPQDLGVDDELFAVLVTAHEVLTVRPAPVQDAVTVQLFDLGQELVVVDW